MKKTSLYVITLLLCMIASCTNKKSQQSTQVDEVELFRSELTTQDTTIMLNMCDNAMEMLKSKRIDEVLASLYLYDDSTKQVSPLPDNLNKRYARMFKMFPVLSYELQYYSFMLEGCNDVKYEVTFASAEQTGNGKPATTMYMFNPVKIGEEWKLCVKTAENGFDQNY